jgi:hypothetical protein
MSLLVSQINAGEYLPLLRFNGEDDGVEEISSKQTKPEIWPDPSPAGLTHLFVKFPTREWPSAFLSSPIHRASTLEPPVSDALPQFPWRRK